MSLDQPIFRKADDGRLLAIRNWRHRNDIEDALIAVPLNREELHHYEKRKRAGASDEEIFDDLFREPVGERIALPITELTKPQIVRLIQHLLEEELNTLSRMSRDELLVLLRYLGRHSDEARSYLL